MTRALCEQVSAFVDGELPVSEHELFRDHLLDCMRCQREFHDALQLLALGEALLDGYPAGAPANVPATVR